MTTNKKKKGFWKNAFAIKRAEDFKASEEELAILDALAAKIVRLGMATPAILFLESSSPLNFIGSQALAFFEPIVRGVFTTWDGYSRFYKMMERRGSVEALIDRIGIKEQEKLEQRKSKDSSDKSKGKQ